MFNSSNFVPIIFQEQITQTHIINMVTNITGMLLVIQPAFLFGDELTTKIDSSQDTQKSIALSCIIFSALICQSNTIVLERRLKGTLIL